MGLYIVNVYSGCSIRRKRALWSNIIAKKNRLNPRSWILGGGFNTVTSRLEKKGRCVRYSEAESQDFMYFLDEMRVVEPISLGKRFSWNQPNGPAASRIDRIILSKDLVERWNIRAQWIGLRDISNHCPIWLISSEKNWGPKPFKFINGWLDHVERKQFMEGKWKECKVEGWMTHIVKEKLKYLKEKLRVWNKEVYDYLDLNIENIAKEINRLEEEIVDEADWNEDVWKGLNAVFWHTLKHKESLLAQKEKTKWVGWKYKVLSQFHQI